MGRLRVRAKRDPWKLVAPRYSSAPRGATQAAAGCAGAAGGARGRVESPGKGLAGLDRTPSAAPLEPGLTLSRGAARLSRRPRQVLREEVARLERNQRRAGHNLEYGPCIGRAPRVRAADARFQNNQEWSLIRYVKNVMVRYMESGASTQKVRSRSRPLCPRAGCAQSVCSAFSAARDGTRSACRRRRPLCWSSRARRSRGSRSGSTRALAWASCHRLCSAGCRPGRLYVSRFVKLHVYSAHL